MSVFQQHCTNLEQRKNICQCPDVAKLQKRRQITALSPVQVGCGLNLVVNRQVRMRQNIHDMQGNASGATGPWGEYHD
ncbi:MAG: hypothetical protein HKO95_15405 [Rhodobacteraceae bacterium]|nr:hypothetical protein [Paracoccaceae bacterium]